MRKLIQFTTWVFVFSSGAWADPPSGGSMGTAGLAVPYAAGVSDVRPGTPEARAQSLTDPNYVDCDQQCLYGKARENLTLQFEYVQKKLDFVRDPSRFEGDRRKVLAGFCGEGDKNSPRETTDDCAERYRKLTDLWLVKVKGALGSQEVAIASLRCAAFNPDGTCKGVKAAPTFQITRKPGEPEKTPQVQYFAKSVDMGQQLQKQIQSGSLKDIKDNATWENNLADSYEPVLEDFIKFKKVPDPANPGSQMDVPVMNDEGLLTYDQAACQRAHAAWEGGNGKGRPCVSRKDKQAALLAKSPPGGISGGGLATAPASSPQVIDNTTGIHGLLHKTTEGQDLVKVLAKNREEFSKEFSGNVKIEARGDSRRIYDAARGQLISSINGDITNWANQAKTKTVTYPTPGASGQPQPTPTPSFIPDEKFTGMEELKTQKGNTSFSRLLYSNTIQVRPSSTPSGASPSPAGLQDVSGDDAGKVFLDF